MSLLAAGMLAACSPPAVKSPLVLDKNTLGSIDLAIEASTLSGGEVAALKKKVAGNLADWHYPIGTKAIAPVSHILTGRIKPVVQSSPPTGFSFSAGNSDPRALEFQKMDVLPVICELASAAQPSQASELSMGFTAETLDKRPITEDKLADHISTVCFNLLREQHWPVLEDKAGESASKPGWFPEVRIENKTVPAAPPAKTSNPEETPAIVVPDEPKQEIIIHNQGSPIILHFGHERR